MTNKKYQVEATKLLKDIKEYQIAVKDEGLTELIRKELVLASLDGELKSLRENKWLNPNKDGTTGT